MGNSFGSSETSFAGAVPQSFYSIVEKDADGNDVSFEKFRGKVVYGVNVATNCGYTKSGYDLISRVVGMKDKGVEVALFPCNQFLWQEPGNDKDIANFCVAKGVKDANLFSKADVNGENTRPTYRFLKSKGILSTVSWNFQGKFIIDKQGNVVPITNHDNVVEQIDDLLKK